MAFFRRKRIIEVEVVSPKLECALEKAFERKKEVDKRFQDIKGITGTHVIEIFIEALAQGKLKKESING